MAVDDEVLVQAVLELADEGGPLSNLIAVPPFRNC
jgi:hypothetical protein